MTQNLCACDIAPHLEIGTRLGLIMHHLESLRTSNTGRLISLAINHSRICIRGLPNQRTDTEGLIPAGYAGLVLYPSPCSVELTKELVAAFSKPLILIALDGNWNQAAKMVRRESVLETLLKVHLAWGPPSDFRLRTQSDVRRVCTFEAVARALGIIEGPVVQQQLEEFFQVMVERMLKARGKLRKGETFAKVSDLVP